MNSPINLKKIGAIGIALFSVSFGTAYANLNSDPGTKKEFVWTEADHLNTKDIVQNVGYPLLAAMTLEKCNRERTEDLRLTLNAYYQMIQTKQPSMRVNKLVQELRASKDCVEMEGFSEQVEFLMILDLNYLKMVGSQNQRKVKNF